MKNYRFLVPIFLIFMFAASVYMLYDKKADVQNQYQAYLDAARDYREQGIIVDAEANYNQAIEVQPSLEVYLELGNYYVENEKNRMADKLSETILELYPDDAKSYEFAVQLYLQQKDYNSCFDVADTLAKRGLKSDLVDAAVMALEYQFRFVGEYEQVGVFGGGMCPVQIGDRWGYVNALGTQTVAAMFEKVGPFSGNLAPVVDADGDVYFIDTAGNKKKVILNVENIEELGLIENDVFRLWDGTSWSFYNSEGISLFGPFDDASNIGNGAAAVMNDGRWSIVDYSGKDQPGKTYDAVAMDEKQIIYRNERCFVSDGQGYQMIDLAGNVYGTDRFEDVHLFVDATYAAVKVGGKWGFIDKNGDFYIEPQYEDARSFSFGLAAVKIDSKWGFIDLEGQVVIAPQFADARDFTTSGTVYVQTGDEWEMLVLYKYNH